MVEVKAADPGEPRLLSNGFTVSQVARDSGVAPSAIRFYEQHGLISSVRTWVTNDASATTQPAA